MKILAVGATGPNAGLVVPELLRRGLVLRALVRESARGDEARRRGAAEVAVGNLGDPASLRAALDGVDGVFHINPAFAPDEANMGVAMVHAAVEAGVSKFVFSSVYHPSLSLTNHAGKRPVEEALYDSPLDYTVLQPAMFMQNLAGSFRAARESGQFAMPYSARVKLAYVDYRDVAEVAARAMTDQRLAYGTFELSAPGMVTRDEIAALMARAAGRAIEARVVEFEPWADGAKLSPGPRREGMKRMTAAYDRFGFTGGNGLVLEALLGRAPRTLRAYLEELAAG